MSTTNLELSRLPMSTVFGAYQRFANNPMPTATKKHCLIELEKWIAKGNITIDDVKNSQPITMGTPVTIGNAVTADPALSAKVDSAGATASRAHDLAMKNDATLSNLADMLAVERKFADTVARQVDALADKVGAFKIDPLMVQAAVAKAVADEFAPFKRVVNDLQAESVVADMSSVHVVDTKSCFEVFGVDVRNAKGQMMTVCLWNDPSAPAIDPDFIWTEDILRHLVLSDVTGENLWFGGERGTGKSETARQFAAATGRAFKRINFHKHTCAEEYLGATGLVDGNTHFEPRDFLMAYTSPSTVILLDEVTNADPGELAPLNGFLEPNAAVSFGGQVWRKAPGVLVFAADNTFGSGDDSGRYAGTRTMNSALIDRFARVIPFTFLPQQSEIEAIVKRTGCTHGLAAYVHNAITVARAKVESAEIVDAPSIRSIMGFIRALSALPAKQAWETAVVARQPSESHAVLRGLYETFIDEVFIVNNI